MQLDYPDITVHKDAAVVLAHAVEKAGASGTDKEAIAQLWTSFLYRFLKFRADWKYEPATAAPAGVFSVHDMVVTPYGLGVVESVRNGGSSYEVMLSWSRAVLQAEYLKPHVDPVMTQALAAVNGLPANIIENSAALDLPPETFFCSASGYVFFQLYQILVQRLYAAKDLCTKVNGRQKLVQHPSDKLATERAAARDKGADDAAPAAEDDVPMGEESADGTRSPPLSPRGMLPSRAFAACCLLPFLQSCTSTSSRRCLRCWTAPSSRPSTRMSAASSWAPRRTCCSRWTSLLCTPHASCSPLSLTPLP